MSANVLVMLAVMMGAAAAGWLFIAGAVTALCGRLLPDMTARPGAPAAAVADEESAWLYTAA